MNITISHDGGAIVLRIEPAAGDPPVAIGGLAIPGHAGATGAGGTRPASVRRSWLDNRPVRLLALGAVLVAFIQIGMVVSGASGTAVQLPVAMAPMSLSGGTSSGGTPSGGPSSGGSLGAKAGHRAVPPAVAIGDALADGSRSIGKVRQPTIASGTAAAQARFGLDP